MSISRFCFFQIKAFKFNINIALGSIFFRAQNPNVGCLLLATHIYKRSNKTLGVWYQVKESKINLYCWQHYLVPKLYQGTTIRFCFVPESPTMAKWNSHEGTSKKLWKCMAQYVGTYWYKHGSMLVRNEKKLLSFFFFSYF